MNARALDEDFLERALDAFERNYQHTKDKQILSGAALLHRADSIRRRCLGWTYFEADCN